MNGLLGPLLLLPSALCAVLPMLVLVAAVWWSDRYAREPLWLFGLTFLWGAIGGVLFAVVGSTALTMPLLALGVAPDVADVIGTVAFAPLAEEPAKAMFLLIVMWNRGFDNMSDGFVYGAAAGLGFGMTENFTYFASAGMSGDVLGWMWLVVIRTFFSAVMHGTATAIVGAALAASRFRGFFAGLAALGIGFPLAMGIHALWNGLLVYDEATGGQGRFRNFDFLALPVEVFVVFAVYQLCLWEESATILTELAEEAKSGVIPKDHPGRLASWWSRHDRRLAPPGVPHAQYVRTATALALRRRQARLAGPGNEFYRDEVVRLRRAVRLLTARAEAKEKR